MKFKTGLFKAEAEDVDIYHRNHPNQFYFSFVWIVWWIFIPTYSIFNFEAGIALTISIISLFSLKAYDSWVLHKNRIDKLEKSGLFK